MGNEWSRKTYAQINAKRLRLQPTEVRRHQRALLRMQFMQQKKQQKNEQENVDIIIEMECIICLDRTANVVSIACGHSVMCKECAEQLSLQTTQCPVCRQ